MDPSALAPAPGTWAPLVAGFILYLGMFVTGFFLDLPLLNTAGGIAMILVAWLGNFRRMLTVSWGVPTAWALLILVSLGATFVVTGEESQVAATLKNALVFVVFLQVYSLRLPPINRSRLRGVLFVAWVVLMLLSVAYGEYFVSADERRLSGLFANPNNLALMGSAPLLLVNEDDSLRRQWVAHALVIAAFALTMTTGALLAYVVALAYRFRSTFRALRWRLPVVAGLAAAVVLTVNGSVIGERITRQYQVIRDNWELVWQSGDIGFGELADEYGAASTSGLWRIAMWRRVLTTYCEGDPQSWIVGRGVGVSGQLFGNLPHNDYLRLLSETGALGLISFLGFFAAIWRRMCDVNRHVVVFFMVYSVTENNLDNFLFITLFMFFLGSLARRPSHRVTGDAPGPVTHPALS